MTLQDVFDRVTHHLLTQNRKSSHGDVYCAYRGANGTRYAIGIFIPNELYKAKFDDRHYLVEHLEIPDHLASLPWYPGHLAWLKDQGLLDIDPPEGADIRRADLRGANLQGAYLLGAYGLTQNGDDPAPGSGAETPLRGVAGDPTTRMKEPP